MDKKIKEILDERKFNAEQIAKNNLLQAFSLPGFKELYALEKSLIIEKTKCEIYEKQFDNKKLEDIINKQNQILKSINLTVKDLTPKYHCPKCEDTGYVKGVLCECVNQINSLINLEKIDMNSLKTFNESDLSIFSNQDIPDFYNKMQLWVKNKKRKFFIVVQGNSGTGKTFLLECLASELIKQNKYVIYTTAFEMNNDFLKYHTTFNEEKMKFISKYLECDALVIDDLGSEPVYKNVTLEYLYLVINQRMIEQKITIISTNLDLSELRDKYGERNFSRLINKKISMTYKFEETDLRLKRTNN